MQGVGEGVSVGVGERVGAGGVGVGEGVGEGEGERFERNGQWEGETSTLIIFSCANERSLGSARFWSAMFWMAMVSGKRQEASGEW